MPATVQEIVVLVQKSLQPPLMGFAGGSATEEQAIDRWRRELRQDLSHLRSTYQPPEVHRLLDAIATNIGD